MSDAIMIDIETLGTSKNSVILAIGAVQFNENGIVHKFYQTVDPTSCQDWGAVIDARTVMWWMEQSDAARKALTSAKTVPLDIALAELSAAFKWKGLDVWTNGIDFDMVILEESYKMVGKPVPWPYWAKKDYRTLKKIAPQAIVDACEEKPVVAYNALADAIAQAATLVNLNKCMNWVPSVSINAPVVKEVKKGKSRAG